MKAEAVGAAPAGFHYLINIEGNNVTRYTSRVAGRKNLYNNLHIRAVKWHGPRFVRGRRSSRSTAVWTLRHRRLCNEVNA
jgi:hypothetical protein